MSVLGLHEQSVYNYSSIDCCRAGTCHLHVFGHKHWLATYRDFSIRGGCARFV